MVVLGAVTIGAAFLPAVGSGHPSHEAAKLSPALAEGRSLPIFPATSPALTVSPTSGYIGQDLTFNGTGFAAKSAVSVTWSGGTACTATTSSAGKFSCSFTMTQESIGGWSFTATDASSNTAATTFTVVPQLTVNPTSGPAGTTVTFSATGFDSQPGYEGYSVTWMAGTVTACTAGGSGVGGFSCAYTIPAGTAKGAYTFTASDVTPNTATATFSVTYTPKLTVSPTTGPVGQTLTFNGSGFATSSLVSVTWSQGTACTATSSSAGKFSCIFILTQESVGGWTFTGTDDASGAGSAVFTIVPQLIATPSSGPAGTLVTFSGTGFDNQPGYDDYSVSWMAGTITACTAAGSGVGTFSCSYTIPAGTPSRVYTFQGYDDTPNSAPAQFNVTYSPKLTVYPTSGFVGQTLTFNGTGFADRSPVIVSWSEGTACTATTSAAGKFSCSFILTQESVGGWTFTGTDIDSGAGSAIFTILPELVVTPTSGPAGTTVTFSGSGFDSQPGYDDYSVSWMAGAATACTAAGSGVGGFSCSFTIPTGTPKGAQTFTGSDDTPNTASTIFTVTYTPKLTVSPSSGHVGQTLTFNGTSFADSSGVTVSWTEGTACTASTSSTGKFSCTFQMTEEYVGPWTFTGTDADSGSGAATFTVTPQLLISPAAGPAGTTITFSGSGFDSQPYYDDYAVTWMAGAVSACSPQGTGLGEFTCQYTLPATPAGVYVFTGSDDTPNTATAKFHVEPTLTDSPVSGLVGTVVTFNGTSFAASSALTLKWPGGTACSATTNTSGDFSCTYTIPAYTLGGSYTFTGTDAAANKATVVFTDPTHLAVSLTSSPVGKTVNFTGKSFAASSLLTVTWTGGTACSTTTTTKGTFSCAFKVPAVAAGSYSFNATDQNFDSAVTALVVTPSLTATPTAGIVGSSITFSGTGFGNGLSVSVAWTGGTACSSTTSHAGSFACSFLLNATPGGLYTFTGTDAHSNAASATFTVDPSLAENVSSGAPGTTVKFTGTGYASTSAITVSWTSGTACTATTNSQGNFSCSFKIPSATSAGNYTFTGTDAQSNSATVTFKVT